MILADDAAVDNFFLLFVICLQELGAGWDVFTTFCCIIERYTLVMRRQNMAPKFFFAS